MPEIIDYIREQPQILANIVANRKEILQDFVDAYLNHTFTKIVLSGTGSSYTASMSSKYFIEKLLQIETTVEYASHASCGTYYPGTMVIGLSKSGESTSPVNSIEQANQLGLLTVAVTSHDGSLITEHAKHKIIVPSGVENAGATTKSYTAMVLVLELLGLEAAYAGNKISHAEYNDYIERVTRVIDNSSAIIQSAEAWYEHNKEDLLRAKSYLITGYGYNYGTVLEAGLKLLETSRIPVSVYELEEFMHGPYNSVDSESVILYAGTPGAGKERILKLAEFFSKITNYGYLLTKKEEKETVGKFGLNFIDDEEFSPIEYIMPLQVLFYKIAKDRGVDMTLPRYLDFHPFLNSKRKLRWLQNQQ
jgi:glucoselysine-6-phosphate deglycase